MSLCFRHKWEVAVILSQRTEAHWAPFEMLSSTFSLSAAFGLIEFNACWFSRPGVTVQLFYPPWWSSFICPLWAEHHLGLVVSTISLAAALPDQTLNRRRKTTNTHIVLSNEISCPSKCTVATKHRAQLFLYTVNELMIINGIIAKFSSVCCIIYFFKLLTFPCSLTSTHPLLLHSHFLVPCSTRYSYSSKCISLHINKSQSAILLGCSLYKYLHTDELHLTLAEATAYFCTFLQGILIWQSIGRFTTIP